MSSINKQKEAFGSLAIIADIFATHHKMSVFHDTYDGANDYILRWDSRNGLDCSITLSDLRVPHEGLRLQAFAKLPKSSALSNFYYVKPPERVFSDKDSALFNDLLEEARTWAEDKQFVHYTGKHSSLKPIFQALKDRNPRQRYVAAMALMKVKDINAVEPLIAALDDADARVCSFAINALGQQGDVRAVKPLLHCLDAGDQGHRVAAARSLGCIRDASAIQPLISALTDEDNEVRSAAAEALGNIGSVVAVDPLIKVFKTGDEAMQIASAKALGQIGDLRAVEMLQEQLMYSYQPLRGVIADAINHIKFSN